MPYVPYVPQEAGKPRKTRDFAVGHIGPKVPYGKLKSGPKATSEGPWGTFPGVCMDKKMSYQASDFLTDLFGPTPSPAVAAPEPDQLREAMESSGLIGTPWRRRPALICQRYTDSTGASETYLPMESTRWPTPSGWN